MTVTTSKGQTFPAQWMYQGPLGELRLQLEDPRRLPDIAADFDGCDRFLRESDEEGNLEFVGYTALTGILRPAGATGDAVQIILEKPERS